MSAHTRKIDRRWRNAPPVRELDVGRSRWLWALLLGIVIAAAPFSIYLIQQMQLVQTRYEIEELRRHYDLLLEQEQRLRIERATLTTPVRVERCAVRNLHLQRPSPRQVAVVQRPGEQPHELLARAPGTRP